ncbi:MAG: response regulator, partial [Gammaproteobacteria bacterium]
KGTGLGLSMVYGFAKQSGGHVKIDSEVGKGTTVRLYLPRSREVEDEVHPLDTRPVVGGSETILVAEDDAGVRVTVVEMLSQLGYRVLQAHDAAEALALIEGGAAVDLLFTDVVMPGALRSPELARRAMALQPDLAVLFTSGYAEDAIVHGGRLDPGVELLGKPYTRAALARKVRHVLRNHQQRRASLRVEPAPRASGGKSIMLVEDDEVIRETTAELLRLLGHSVIAVPSGEHAIGQLRDRTVDVLMTDLGLPGMSGEELVTQVRRSQPGVRVLFATGRDMEVTIADAAVLLKPYSVDKLMAALG